ncbi:MAG: T9SS type A sorting domain-containing protein, partial [Bacteroidota bacterium]
ASDNGDGFIFQGSVFSKLYADDLTGKDSIDFTGNWRIWLAQYNTSGDLTKFSNIISNGSFMTPAAIKSDDSGMIYIAGKYYSHPEVGIYPDTAYLPSAGGATDIYLVKVDSFNFHRQWQQRIHGAGNDDVQALEFDANENLVVAGSYTTEALFGTLADTTHLQAATGGNEIFMTSYDTSGNLNYAMNAGYGIGGAITPYSITHSDSLIYVVGHYTGTPVFGEGADTFSISWIKNFYVAAYTDSGKLHWARSSYGSFVDGLNGVTVDDSGFVYPAGFFSLYCILDTSATDTIYLNSSGVDDVFVGRIGYKISVTDTTIDTTGNFISERKTRNNIFLYPNPSSEKLNLEWSENSNPVAVTVYNLFGEIVYSENTFNSDRELILDVRLFANGNYFIQVKTKTEIQSGKFSVFRN